MNLHTIERHDVISHLFIRPEPAGISFVVCVFETKVPYFSEAYGAGDLLKQLLSTRLSLRDRECGCVRERLSIVNKALGNASY